jgi:hypothetical protein
MLQNQIESKHAKLRIITKVVMAWADDGAKANCSRGPGGISRQHQ